jgi:GDPmannose 4,6-dehydratase
MKTALIYGVTGQDGSYLSEYLLEKKYKVVGVKRRSSSINTMRVDHLIKNYSEEEFNLLHGDITDTSSVYNIVSKVQPDEIYNLAAQSHVGVSFNEPEYTSQVDAVGTLRLIEAAKSIVPNSKYYQASTSELYAGLSGNLLNEESMLNPRSPYAAAKLYAYYIVKQYREGYGMKSYNGILFNHESPRRGENFVSRKITLALNQIINEEIESIELGNLDSIRDWGHAKDYVRGMHMMLQKAAPDDYVLATGQCYSVRDFCIKAFDAIGCDIEFTGEGLNEVAKVIAHKDSIIKCKKPKIGQSIIKVDKKFFRPLDVPHLQGDSSKFRKETGWAPQISFDELVFDMVQSDLL